MAQGPGIYLGAQRIRLAPDGGFTPQGRHVGLHLAQLPFRQLFDLHDRARGLDVFLGLALVDQGQLVDAQTTDRAAARGGSIVHGFSHGLVEVARERLDPPCAVAVERLHGGEDLLAVLRDGQRHAAAAQ